MKKDYYEILGIDKGATAEQIKKAYRKKAIEYHPDKNPGDKEAEENFKKAAEAYEVLSDPDKKARYDQYGHAAFEGGGGFNGGGMNMDDIFSQFGDIFGSAFGGGFGGFGGFGGGGGQRRMKGSNLRIKVKLTLEEVVNGVEKKIKVKRKVRAKGVSYKTCPTCNGAGKIIRDPCKKCAGQGRVKKEKALKVKIPAGIESGRRIRLAGEGEAGFRGGPPGDLYVLLSVKAHKLFKRDGANLHCRVPIPMTTAALGGEIEVPIVSGSRTKVKIPEGTQTGQQLRLKGKGMPILRSEAVGDMFIEVQVETPMNLNRKQQDLLKELDKSLGGTAQGKHSPEATGFFTKMKEAWSDLKD